MTKIKMIKSFLIESILSWWNKRQKQKQTKYFWKCVEESPSNTLKESIKDGYWFMTSDGTLWTLDDDYTYFVVLRKFTVTKLFGSVPWYSYQDSYKFPPKDKDYATYGSYDNFPNDEVKSFMWLMYYNS